MAHNLTVHVNLCRANLSLLTIDMTGLVDTSRRSAGTAATVFCQTRAITSDSVISKRCVSAPRFLNVETVCQGRGV